MQYLVQSMCPVSDFGFVDDGGNNTDLFRIFFNSPHDLYSILTVIRYCHQPLKSTCIFLEGNIQISLFTTLLRIELYSWYIVGIYVYH